MLKPWLYSSNVFLRISEKSLLRAMNMGRYHDSALEADKSDPFIMPLYNVFHPLYLTFVSIFDTWKKEEGSSAGKTLNLNQLLKLLAQTKIKAWDVRIQTVYDQSTPRYKALLPVRRKPFQSGKKHEIIERVKTLSQAIGSDEALQSVKTEVDEFYTQLHEALASQKGNFSTHKGVSVQLDAARVDMCKVMFSNLGALIQKYPDNPQKIEQYFDMKSIRRPGQSLYTGTLKPRQINSVLKHTFNAGDQVVLSNLTNATLKFYLSKLRDDEPGTKFVELSKGDQTVPAEQLGDLSDPFLTVMNTDGDIVGKYEVEIV